MLVGKISGQMQQSYSFKECGECHACCAGVLVGSAYGNKFGAKYGSCSFLVDKECSIYKDRPETCKSFQCAWTQHLFSEEDMRPDKSGLMVSVETDKDNKQYLAVSVFKQLVDYKHYKAVEDFCERNNTYYKLIRITGGQHSKNAGEFE